MSPAPRHRRTVLATTLGLLALTLAVAAGWWPVSLDERLAAALPGPGEAPHLLRLADAVTWLATPVTSVVLTLAVAAWLSRRQRDARALRAAVVPLAWLTLGVLTGKALLHRAGPAKSPLHDLLGYYPSGHTATALVCTGVLAHLVTRRSPARRGRLLLASAAWTAVVAASLVVHRYHWLSDVVGGALLGALVLLLSRPLLSAPARTAPRSG